MEKIFVAQGVATKLFATESSVDQAMVEATELLAEMLKARSEVGASTTFANDAQVKMMEALAALSAARTAMVGVHSELAEAQLRLGIRTKMVGEMYKPPAMTIAQPASLRQVG
jgi:flagellin-like hook-associated protein FlgL